MRRMLLTMARKLRIEEKGGLYHVINRGNYRGWVFRSEGARVEFEKALFEACERAGWVLHAYAIMGNHYHLALETSEGNLSEGMRWLQSTFANRFNRHRNTQGRLFQGRFKSLQVENRERLAWLCHYIHLNPVRAEVCTVAELKNHRWCSSWFWRRAKARPGFLNLETCLSNAGSLADTRAGWTRYERYLSWLNTVEAEQKRMEFAKMSKGWALGTRDFKKTVAEKHLRGHAHLRLEQKDAREARQLYWESRLERCLKVLRKKPEMAAAAAKSAPWKIAIAAHMKERLLCSNAWLAEQLNMGVLYAVSRYTGDMHAGRRPEAEQLWQRLNAKIKQ